MNGEIPMAIPAMDAAGLIGFDLACIGCGYNLRGLRGDGVCPECANPIAPSLRGERLVYASPEWLKKLRRGTALMLWYIVISVLLLAGVFVVDLRQFGPTLSMAPGILTKVLFVAAAFYLTMREPRTRTSAKPEILRNVIRYGVAAACVGQLMLFVAGGFGSEILGGIGALLAVGDLVAIVGILLLLRRLARRIPDEKLAKSTGTLLWGGLIAALLLAASAIVPLLPGNAGSTNSTFLGAGVLLSVSGGITFLLVAVMFVQTMINYHKAFKLAAREAESNSAIEGRADATRTS